MKIRCDVLHIGLNVLKLVGGDYSSNDYYGQ